MKLTLSHREPALSYMYTLLNLNQHASSFMRDHSVFSPQLWQLKPPEIYLPVHTNILSSVCLNKLPEYSLPLLFPLSLCDHIDVISRVVQYRTSISGF